MLRGCIGGNRKNSGRVGAQLNQLEIEKMRQDYDNGKYTVIFDRETGELRALRNGELWQDLSDNKLVYLMLVEHQRALDRIAELERFKAAYEEWHEKTEWVQETATYKELGKHRADVLRERIAELEQRLEVRADGKPDDIYCRDQTIAAQDEIIDDLRKKVVELEKDAARLDWMQENYLCADFMYGEPATEGIFIEFPEKSRYCGDLRTDVDTAMQKG